jgi:hypothetical protein
MVPRLMTIIMVPPRSSASVKVEFLNVTQRRVRSGALAEFKIGRRQLFAAASAALVVSRWSSPAPAAAANSQLSGGLSASIESLRLFREAVKVGGQQRSEATIKNPHSVRKAGVVLSECRNTNGVVVDKDELQLVLDAGETVVLIFTSDVGTAKGVSFIELKTGTSSMEAPFEVT